MNLWNKKVAAFIVLVAAVVTSVYFFVLSQDRKIENFDQLKKNWGFSLTTTEPQLLLNPLKSRLDSNSSYQEALFEGEDYKFSVTKMPYPDSEKAKDVIQNKIKQYITIYEPPVDNYFPAIKKIISCPDEYKIKLHDLASVNQPHTVVEMFANDRFALGACLQETIKYKVLISFSYCAQSQSIFRIEYYKDAKTYEGQMLDHLKKMTCL